MNKFAVVVGLMVLLITLASLPIIAFGTATTEAKHSEAAVGNEGAVEVTECQVIDEPGRYVLTEDIRDSGARICIEIVASDVVFDGQGHTLDARKVDQKTEGVAAGYTDPPIENVTIQNLVVTDWVQGVGCTRIANDVTVRNVTARRNGRPEYASYSGGYGIYVGEFTDNVTVVDNVAVNNYNGIVIDETNDTVIRDNLVEGNEVGGIFIGTEAWHNRIFDNRISDNRWGVVVQGSNHTTVASNVIRGNNIGVRVSEDVFEVTIADNRIQDTLEPGIFVGPEPRHVLIESNRITGSVDEGIRLDGTAGAVVRGNVIRNVSRSGVRLQGSRDIVLKNLTVQGVGEGAISATEGTKDLRVFNLSLSSGRMSYSGGDVRISAAEPAAPLPEGTTNLGVAVRIQLRGGDSADVTLHLPKEVTLGGSVGLWRFDDEWSRVAVTSIEPSQNSLSTNLTDPQGVKYVVIAKTETNTPTRTASPSPEPSPNPTTTPGQSGFGFAIVLAVLFGAMLLVRRHRG